MTPQRRTGRRISMDRDHPPGSEAEVRRRIEKRAADLERGRVERLAAEMRRR